MSAGLPEDGSLRGEGAGAPEPPHGATLRMGVWIQFCRSVQGLSSGCHTDPHTLGGLRTELHRLPDLQVRVLAARVPPEASSRSLQVVVWGGGASSVPAHPGSLPLPIRTRVLLGEGPPHNLI